MKHSIFKVKFLQEKIIVERREMARSIRLETLYHISYLESFVSGYLNASYDEINPLHSFDSSNVQTLNRFHHFSLIFENWVSPTNKQVMISRAYS